MTRDPARLRSARWYGPADLRSFGHRSRTKQMGYAAADWAGKPVVGILNTWSDINPCHQHFRTRAEEVKRGVWQAGGFPLEIPALALPENFMKPTTMLYRNLLAMEVEEIARSLPLDALVLMCGCDKTVPAMIMGAISVDLPAIVLPAGAMLRGFANGHVLGSGSDSWKYWAELRAGTIGPAEWQAVEDGIARSWGTCMTMGTASTMAAVAEALGLTLPGASSIPAPDAGHARMATVCGRRAVDLAWDEVRPSTLLGRPAFMNAVRVALALGGSTNAVVHLIAMARRAGVGLTLDDIDAASRMTPLLANLRPSGAYLMEDFYYAGGLPGLMGRIADLLDGDAPTVTGARLGAGYESAPVWNDAVIRTRDNPLHADAGLVVLRGNLAPDGAVIKAHAAEARLLTHRGPAVVFEDYKDLAARIDDPALEVDADSVLVLRHAGPVGGPGMPEWGMLPIPRKLLRTGVRDMVRVSDARMSGTSYGTCVLHVAPESAVGGPLALVRSGDVIRLDVSSRTLTLEVGETELAARRAAWRARPMPVSRGYLALAAREVGQANEGCDWRVLEGTERTPEPEIH